jgi:hypothetical protein
MFINDKAMIGSPELRLLLMYQAALADISVMYGIITYTFRSMYRSHAVLYQINNEQLTGL